MTTFAAGLGREIVEVKPEEPSEAVRPGSEYHEDMGPVLWLCFETGAAPLVHAGMPTDSDWPFLDDAVTVFAQLPTYASVRDADKKERAIRAALADAIVAERARCVTIAQKGRRKVDVAAGYQAALAVDEHIIEPIERGEQP